MSALAKITHFLELNVTYIILLYSYIKDLLFFMDPFVPASKRKAAASISASSLPTIHSFDSTIETTNYSNNTIPASFTTPAHLSIQATSLSTDTSDDQIFSSPVEEECSHIPPLSPTTSVISCSSSSSTINLVSSSAVTSTTVPEMPTLTRRPTTRVEEIVHMIESGELLTSKRPPYQGRRYSVDSQLYQVHRDQHQQHRRYIKDREYKYDPVMGEWKKRIHHVNSVRSPTAQDLSNYSLTLTPSKSTPISNTICISSNVNKRKRKMLPIFEQ